MNSLAETPALSSAPFEESALFRALVENIGDVICLIDAAGCILWLSSSLTKVLGWRPEERLGASTFDLLHPEHRVQAEAALANLLQEPGATRHFESWVRHKNGSWRWVEATGTNLLHDPAVRALVINYRDVTDRKRTADALQTSEREFRTFFEMIGVGSAEADPATGSFLRVNRKLSEITGYSVDELLQTTWPRLLHPDDSERALRAWQEVVDRGEPEYSAELRYVRKDSSLVWVQVTASVMRDEKGRPVRALAVMRDVSDRRRALDELKQARSELEARVMRRTAELAGAKAQLETLIEASPLSIVALDRDLFVQMWNPAAEELFGWRQEEVLGHLLPTLPRENHEHYLEEIRRLSTEPAGTCLETQRQKRDGTLVDVSIWIAPLFDARGEQTGCMGITMDTTERKRLERALLEASEREQRRIGQDLHDHLCQHLLGVACMLKVLANTAEEEGSKRARDLHQAAGLVNDAVQQARDVARGLHPVALDAEGLMSALRELASRVSPTLSCELDCPHPVLIEDPTAAMHFYRIAQEAVTNAVKHSGARRLRIQLREEKDQVRLQVRDDGRGFPPLKNIHAHSGGMGLDIMRYRAHAIGGRLLLETQPADGACVTCTLPKHPPSSPP